MNASELLDWLKPDAPLHVRRFARELASRPLQFERIGAAEYLLDGAVFVPRLRLVTAAIHEACGAPGRPQGASFLVGPATHQHRRKERARARISRAVEHIERVSPALANALRASLFVQVDDDGQVWLMYRPRRGPRIETCGNRAGKGDLVGSGGDDGKTSAQEAA